MCIIPPKLREKYLAGKVALKREIHCEECGKAAMIEAKVKEKLRCPSCNSKKLKEICLHLPEGVSALEYL